MILRFSKRVCIYLHNWIPTRLFGCISGSSFPLDYITNNECQAQMWNPLTEFPKFSQQLGTRVNNMSQQQVLESTTWTLVIIALIPVACLSFLFVLFCWFFLIVFTYLPFCLFSYGDANTELFFFYLGLST